MKRIEAMAILPIFIFPVVVVFFWYVKVRWEKREMFRKLKAFKIVPSPPLIGYMWNFLGCPPCEIYQRLVKVVFEYGPTFAVWFIGVIPFVVVGKPEDLEAVLQSQNCLQKGYLYKFTRNIVGTGLFSAPVDRWRKTRKIINPTFNSRILENFMSIFASTTTICVDEILPKFVKQTDIDWYKILTITNLDTISQTAMGLNTDAQRKVSQFAEWLESIMKITVMRMFNIMYHLDFIFFRTKTGKELYDSRQNLWNLTDRVVKERKEKFKMELESGEHASFLDDDGSIRKKAFLDLLLELDHKGEYFSDVELRDEVNTFFVGGTDTTAVTSCFFLTLMGMYPNIQEKVLEEILEVLGPDRNPTMEDISKLKLLDRCIKETMRIFPPVPFVLREASHGDVKLPDGKVIPKGASIFVPIIFMHRSHLYWDNPLTFDPNRFLSDRVIKRHPFTFIPFSGGLRGCIAQRYSLNNLKTLLSAILRKFCIKCDAYKNIEDIKLQMFLVLRPIDGFKFTIEERL